MDEETQLLFIIDERKESYMTYTDGWEMWLLIVAIVTVVVTCSIYIKDRVQKRRNFFFKRVSEFNHRVSEAFDDYCNKNNQDILSKSSLDAKYAEAALSRSPSDKAKAAVIMSSRDLMTKNLKAHEGNLVIFVGFDFFSSALAPDMIKMGAEGKVIGIKYFGRLSLFHSSIKVNGVRRNKGKMIADCLNEIIRLNGIALKRIKDVDINIYLNQIKLLSTEIANIIKGFIKMEYTECGKLKMLEFQPENKEVGSD